eukprot:1145381-Pelagomonas_calceolata.AAC.5
MLQQLRAPSAAHVWMPRLLQCLPRHAVCAVSAGGLHSHGLAIIRVGRSQTHAPYTSSKTSRTELKCAAYAHGVGRL